MARLAIFIDGGYYSALAEKHYGVRFDFPRLIEEIRNVVATKTPETLDILRTFYYDCLPYQSSNPTLPERQRYGKKLGFLNYLGTLPRVQVRRGRLAYRGQNDQGVPIFQQKQVDLLLGLDFAEQSMKGHLTHLALVAGDGDYCPAVDFAKAQSVCVWLFHGPKVSPATGESTYAQGLWMCCDERCEMNQQFIDRVKR